MMSHRRTSSAACIARTTWPMPTWLDTMKNHMRLLPLGLATLAFGLCAWAADAFYVGTWKIDSAVVGPWWTEKQKPDQAEMKSLVGKSFTIGPKNILRARQVACKDPKYQVKDYPADMLFQGAFGEMQSKDKSVDPAKV